MSVCVGADGEFMASHRGEIWDFRRHVVVAKAKQREKSEIVDFGDDSTGVDRTPDHDDLIKTTRMKTMSMLTIRPKVKMRTMCNGANIPDAPVAPSSRTCTTMTRTALRVPMRQLPGEGVDLCSVPDCDDPACDCNTDERC
jgi:hypothetical protein